MDEIIRCRDCIYYKEDWWTKVNGIPIIAAHHICEKWGNGCGTQPDGYCFMAVKKEETDGSKEQN